MKYSLKFNSADVHSAARRLKRTKNVRYNENSKINTERKENQRKEENIVNEKMKENARERSRESNKGTQCVRRLTKSV